MGLTEFEKQYIAERKAAQKKYREYRSFVEVLFGYCPCCGRYFRWSVKTLHRNTRYCEEADNWLTACKKCQEEDDEYFSDLWEQYYGSI